MVLARLCEPASELHLAETWYRQTALEDLLGVPAALVNDDRCYRALDQLLPQKAALEQHLVTRLGALFALDQEPEAQHHRGVPPYEAARGHRRPGRLFRAARRERAGSG